jgi:hypothetical protein
MPATFRQRFPIRINRPLVAAVAVPGLDGQRHIEAQLMKAAGPREQQVDGLALTRPVHPDQPRPRAVVVPRQVGSGDDWPTKLLGLK